VTRSSVARRARAVLATSLLTTTVWLVAAPAPAAAATVWYAFMTGDQEVPGPGDDDADGVARLTVDPPSGEVCVRWDILNIDPATAAHIHSGAEGVAGAIVVTLPTPDADGLGDECVNGILEATLQAIVDDPASFYVNVHNAAFPDGAARGQLEPIEVIINGITVAKAVCPAEIQTSAELLAAPAGTCTPAARTGDVDPPPPGTVYDPPVLLFDMEIELEDPGGTLTIDDAELDGGFSCDLDSCSGSRTYRWGDAFVGPSNVFEATFPEGYQFGWATIQSALQGGDTPAATVDTESGRIFFDTTGFGDSDGFLVTLYDFIGTSAPSAGPTVTLPATSTAPSPRTPTGSNSLLAAALILFAGSCLALVMKRNTARKEGRDKGRA